MQVCGVFIRDLLKGKVAVSDLIMTGGLLRYTGKDIRNEANAAAAASAASGGGTSGGGDTSGEDANGPAAKVAVKMVKVISSMYISLLVSHSRVMDQPSAISKITTWKMMLLKLAMKSFTSHKTECSIPMEFKCVTLQASVPTLFRPMGRQEKWGNLRVRKESLTTSRLHQNKKDTCLLSYV